MVIMKIVLMRRPMIISFNRDNDGSGGDEIAYASRVQGKKCTWV